MVCMPPSRGSLKRRAGSHLVTSQGHPHTAPESPSSSGARRDRLEEALDEVGDAPPAVLSGADPSGPGVTIGIGDDAAARPQPGTAHPRDRRLSRRGNSFPRGVGGLPPVGSQGPLHQPVGRVRHGRHTPVRDHQPLPARGATFGFVDGLYDGLLERAAETSVELIGGTWPRVRGGIVVGT